MAATATRWPDHECWQHGGRMRPELTTEALYERELSATIKAALRHPEPYKLGDENCPGCRAEKALDALTQALEDACEVAVWLSALVNPDGEEWDHWANYARPKLWKALDARQQEAVDG